MTVTVSKFKSNLRSKLNDALRYVGFFGNDLLRSNTAADAHKLLGLGNKNLLLNGNLRVSQRGDYTTATDFPINSYFLDRWKSDGNIACTLRHIDVDMPLLFNSKNALRLQATAWGTSYYGVIQQVEEYSFLKEKEITISAWVRTNSPDVRISFYYGDNTFYLMSKAHSGSGNWEKLTVTGRVLSTPSTARFGVYQASATLSNVTVNSGDYIEFTEAQLELGSTATPFEYRPYQQELALCQRYYTRLNLNSYGRFGSVGFCNLATRAYFNIALPVTMRTTPSASVGPGSFVLANNNGSAPLSALSGLQGTSWISFTAETNGTLTVGQSYQLYSTSNSYIAFSSEL